MTTTTPAATWQPLESGLVQLVGLLTDYQRPGTNQAKIFQQLEACQQYPDFNNYLAYIFAAGESLTIEVRQSAGLLLKNNLAKQYGTLSPDFKIYIKATLLPVLGHASKELRHTAGTIASVLVGLGGMEQWQDLVAAIIHCLSAQEANVLDGGLDTLYKILEDHPQQVEAPIASAANAPASTLVVPPLLRLMQSPAAAVRRSAIASLNMMAQHMPLGLMNNVDAYLHGLFALANDTTEVVRCEVVGGLVAMTRAMPDKLAPFMTQLIEYMLASNEFPNQAVALAAAEFWSSYMELDPDPALLRPYLTRLIPLLMTNMVFDEFDDEVQEAEAAEEAREQKEDRDQDLKPFHHRQKEHSAGGDGAAPAADNGDAGAGGEEEEDDSTFFSQWNLRKCSAEALDILSNTYGDDLLPLLLPIVQQRLQDEKWRLRESAILALGAVSQGCSQGLQPYLEGIIHMLLPRLRDPRPMVRIISCWTLSRYAHWLFLGVVERGAAARPVVDQVVGGVLASMADRNKYVQVAAVSALVEVVETASEGHRDADKLLEPYIKAMLDAMAVSVSRATRRSVAVTYEALAIVSRVLHGRMAEPAFAGAIMPPMFNKFMSLSPTDKDLLPLMECLASLTPNVGRQLEPYAKPMFDRALTVAATHLEAQQRAQAAAAAAAAAQGAAAAAAAGSSSQPSPSQEYDSSFVVMALDAISGLAQALGPSVETLVAASPLVQVLLHCSSDAAPEVRQSSFALVGDLAISCVAHLLPVLPQLVAAALALLELPRLTNETMSSANNACWALGEVAIKVDADRLIPHAETIGQRTAAILCYQGRMPSSILENAAITLGRVAWRCPDQLAPHLPHFAAQWTAQLRNIRDGTEKEHAFLGLCRLVRMNPEAAVPCFSMLCQAFASWRRVSCEGLHNEMAQILQLYKANLSAAGSWPQVYGTVGDPVKTKFAQMGIVL